jgi:hypothetical protein
MSLGPFFEEEVAIILGILFLAVCGLLSAGKFATPSNEGAHLIPIEKSRMLSSALPKPELFDGNPLPRTDESDDVPVPMNRVAIEQTRIGQFY